MASRGWLTGCKKMSDSIKVYQEVLNSHCALYWCLFCKLGPRLHKMVFKSLATLSLTIHNQSE